MHRLEEFELPQGAPAALTERVAPLSEARKGHAGVIAEVRPAEVGGGLPGAEIERRLLEMGLVEGAPIEVLHEGLFGRDPIAVKLDDRTVALRRREARAVLVRCRTEP